MNMVFSRSVSHKRNKETRQSLEKQWSPQEVSRAGEITYVCRQMGMIPGRGLNCWSKGEDTAASTVPRRTLRF